MNNIDKRDKLKKYIQEINPVFWETEGKTSFEKLSDEEVELLFKLCEEKFNYNAVIKQMAYEADSQKAQEIEEQCEKELADSENQYERDIEKIELEEDTNLDKTYEEEAIEVTEIDSDVEKIAEALINYKN